MVKRKWLVHFFLISSLAFNQNLDCILVSKFHENLNLLIIIILIIYCTKSSKRSLCPAEHHSFDQKSTYMKEKNRGKIELYIKVFKPST